MSTKVNESCTYCGFHNSPQEKVVEYEDVTSFTVKLWRYYCFNCKWIWANKLQREHNAVEYKKAKKLVKTSGWNW